MNIKPEDLLKLKEQKDTAHHNFSTGAERIYTKDRIAELEWDRDTIDMMLKNKPLVNRSREDLEESEKRFNLELSDPDGSINFLNNDGVKHILGQMPKEDATLYKRDMLIYYKDMAFGNQNISDVERALVTEARISKEYPSVPVYNIFQKNFVWMKQDPNPDTLKTVEEFMKAYPKSKIVEECKQAFDLFKKTDAWRRDVARAINPDTNSDTNSDTSFDNYEFWGLFFQENNIEALEELHNNIIFYSAIVLFAISWMLVSKLYKKIK